MDFWPRSFRENFLSYTGTLFLTKRHNIWRNGRINDLCTALTKKMERLFSASALYTVHLSCHRLWSDKKWIFKIFQPSQGVGKILTNIWQTNFFHLYRISGKCTHYMHFLIFAPNPNSNAALWNVRAWPANARTSPANFGFRPKFSFRCRTV